MKLFSRLSLAAALVIGLAACSSSDDDEDIMIAELTDIEEKFEPKINWQEQVGGGVEGHFSRLMPVLNKEVVYAASREGIVSAFSFVSGDELWSVDIRKEAGGYLSGLFSEKASARVSGGLTVAYDKVYLGTENGEVISLDATNGSIVWRKPVKGEVIAPPAAGEGLIVVNTGAGYLVALHPDNGEMRWEYEQEVPSLTLRGISTPLVDNGGVIFGSANGKLNVVIADSGIEAWKQSVATAVGASELERLVDVDSQPVVLGDTIYSLAYNGNLLAVNLRSGQIKWKKEYSSYLNLSMSGFMLYLTDYMGHIYAVDSRDGSEVWKQNSMTNRGLTGAYSHGDYVVVGDTQGYLHWLDKDNGEFVARIELDDTGLYVEAIGKDNTIVVQTRDGEVSVISVP